METDQSALLDPFDTAVLEVVLVCDSSASMEETGSGPNGHESVV
ncbi:MAG: hypothetical protein ACYCZE_08780 [Thiobacillus sp.]